MPTAQVWPGKNSGFTLVELLIGLAVLAISITLVLNSPKLISLNTRNSQISLAKDIVGKQLDYLRKKSYINLVNTTSTPFSDSAMTALPGCGGGNCGTYEVSNCPPSWCTNPSEKVKLVKVKLIWNGEKAAETLEVTTLIGSGGIAH